MGIAHMHWVPGITVRRLQRCVSALAAAICLCGGAFATDGDKGVSIPRSPETLRLMGEFGRKYEAFQALGKELTPRCKKIVQEQSTFFEISMDFCIKKYGDPNVAPDESAQEFWKCGYPIVQRSLENLQRFGNGPNCPVPVSSKDCRGAQCPPSPELTAQADKNFDLAEALLKDSMGVCPKAYMGHKRPFEQRVMQCAIEFGADRTGATRCINDASLKTISELRTATRKLCNAELKP